MQVCILGSGSLFNWMPYVLVSVKLSKKLGREKNNIHKSVNYYCCSINACVLCTYRFIYACTYWTFVIEHWRTRIIFTRVLSPLCTNFSSALHLFSSTEQNLLHELIDGYATLRSSSYVSFELILIRLKKNLGHTYHQDHDHDNHSLPWNILLPTYRRCQRRNAYWYKDHHYKYYKISN